VFAGTDEVAVQFLHLNERVSAPNPVACVDACIASSSILCSSIGFASTVISFSVPQYWHLSDVVPGW